MGKEPIKTVDNIYFKCRKEAAKSNEMLNSREGAAKLLGISVSSISEYELGLTKVVPVDKVALMADLYNAPELKTNYCSECCPLGTGSSKIVLQDLDRIALKALGSFRKIAVAKESLLNIVEDGMISEAEKPELEEILTVMDEVETVIRTFKLWAEKNM